MKLTSVKEKEDAVDAPAISIPTASACCVLSLLVNMQRQGRIVAYLLALVSCMIDLSRVNSFVYTRWHRFHSKIRLTWHLSGVSAFLAPSILYGT